MTQRYPYLPLQASGHQIRLLTLLPGEFSSTAKDVSPIEIDFQTISFDSASSQASLRLSFSFCNMNGKLFRMTFVRT
jgi:hypothetical protein